MLVLLLASCSGPGESGTESGSGIGLSALVLPEKVSVVDPQASGGSSKPQAKAGQLAMIGALLGGLTPMTDYQSDKVSVYVNERSLESFKTVNEILCMLKQSRYDAMLNQGPYKAQVDKNLCSSNRDNASTAGESTTNQSSGSTMPVYENWTVNSYRTGANSPHIVHAWVHSVERSDEPPMVIHAKVVITEGADTAPPYGIFKASFKALDKQTLSTVLFKGLLNAERDPLLGKVLLKFTTEDKDSYMIEKATLDKTADGSQGAGSVFTAESFPGRTTKATRFNIAYNSNNFLRVDNDNAEICLDRTEFDESAWKYGLYTSDGSRVNLRSGFPIKISDAYGWVGYWGTWFPAGVTVSNGQTVLQHDYVTNTDSPYTVIKAEGKLKKHSLNNITLGDIKNIPLIWWDGSTGTTETYLIVWDGFKFSKVAQQELDGTWKTIATVDLSLSSLPWVELWVWSQSLSGMAVIRLPAPTAAALSSECTANGTSPQTFNCAGKASSSTPVVYYAENIIYPKDAVPTTLACFDNCPNVATLATATPYRTDIVSYQTTTPALAAYAAYSFDNTTMLLSNMGTAVTLTTQNTSYPWGITSGPLFDPADLNLLACDWNTGETCGWKAWSMPVFYTWETGPNDWNQFTGLKDASGNPVLFDPPLQVEYVHVQTDAGKADFKYNGTKFYLEYAGFGDLHGIPGKCVNIDEGTDADCGTAAGNPAVRWVPEFTVPDTQPIGAPSPGHLTEVTKVGTTVKYFVKALEKEERMKGVAIGVCSGLSTMAYTLPSMSSYNDPALGPEPTVIAPPAVIGGVVQ